MNDRLLKATGAAWQADATPPLRKGVKKYMHEPLAQLSLNIEIVEDKMALTMAQDAAADGGGGACCNCNCNCCCCCAASTA